VPGVEGCGIVTEVGADIEPARVGTRVAWSRVQSSYATEVQGSAASFIEIPDGIDDRAAAGVLMQGITAQYLATSTTALEHGQWAVVTAAAGGVGGLLTQMLVSRGVNVVGVVGSQAKVTAAARNGAHHVLASTDAVVNEVRGLVPAGVDAVFDANGGDINPLFGLLRPRGICVLYGSASGSLAPIDPGAVAAGSFYVTRTAGRDYTSGQGEWASRATDVLNQLSAGTLTVHIDHEFALHEAAEAHRLMESRATTGKVLLSCQ